jgi:thiol-disulfide isomerase/thioredoxin
MVAKRSTKMGKLMPYVDVRSSSDVPKFESMVKMGPVFVLVYADWCGHCKRFKSNMWDEVANSPNKTTNTAAVHYNMVDKTSMRGTPIEGYPTLFEVKPTPKANVSTPVETPQTKEDLETMVGVNNAVEEDPSRVSEPLNSNENLIRSATIAENSRRATANTFTPMESLPPPEEEAMEPSINRASAPQGGGSLMETLLKVTADGAHVLVLAGSAAELNRRMKKRRRTHKHKKYKSSKKQSRRR